MTFFDSMAGVGYIDMNTYMMGWFGVIWSLVLECDFVLSIYSHGVRGEGWKWKEKHSKLGTSIQE